MSTQDKLADLENRIVRRLSWLRVGSPIDMQAFTADIEAMLAQAHAAEAARAQAQSDEWVMVPREPTKAMIDAVCKIKLDRLEALRSGREASSGVVSAAREEWEAMLAAATQPPAVEPVLWIDAHELKHAEAIEREIGTIPVSTTKLNEYFVPLYAHPQPAQDAKDWTDEQCIEFMQIGLRNVQYASVKGAAPTVEEIRQGAHAAMAKESGR